MGQVDGLSPHRPEVAVTQRESDLKQWAPALRPSPALPTGAFYLQKLRLHSALQVSAQLFICLWAFLLVSSPWG